MTEETAKALGVLIVIIAMVVVGPLLTIWALNTLFPVLAIDYNISTWSATILLGAALRGNVKINKD